MSQNNHTIWVKEPKHVVIEPSSIPQPKPGEALLKMLYGGICGSDLGTYRGTFAYASYPRIPGHEFSAEIIEIEPNEFGLEKGMIVTANPYFNCGKCYSCKRGYVNACEHNETMGAQRDGAFSKYITMPIKRLYDGKGVSPKELALVEPYCISHHGVSRAHVKPSDKVLIIGAGTIGMMALLAAKQKGASVYISDVSMTKIDYAKAFGVDGYIENKNENHFLEEVKRLTDGHGFDVVIEAVGLPSTFQNAIDAACFAGEVVIIGVGKKNHDFNFTLIQKKELNIYGSRNALKKDFLETIDALKNGNLQLEQMITNLYPFEDAPQAFSDFDLNVATMLKVMIKF